MLRVTEYFAKLLDQGPKVPQGHLNGTLECGVCKSLLVFNRNYVCISYRSEIFSVKEYHDL